MASSQGSDKWIRLRDGTTPWDRVERTIVVSLHPYDMGINSLAWDEPAELIEELLHERFLSRFEETGLPRFTQVMSMWWNMDPIALRFLLYHASFPVRHHRDASPTYFWEEREKCLFDAHGNKLRGWAK